MKKFWMLMTALSLAVFLPAQRHAQKKLLKDVDVIAEVEDDDGETTVMVFSMPENRQNRYFLSVGHLGIGDDIIQFSYDPVHVLFIPLGDTLDEAGVRLEEFKELASQPKGTSMETVGCLSFPYPNDNLETVTVSAFKLLVEKKLMFKVTRGEYIRATYVTKSDIAAMLSGVKLYRKLHPKEK